MRTDELIVELVRDASRVQRLDAAWLRAARWMVVAVAALVAGVAILGPRSDWQTVLSNGRYLATWLVTLGIVLLSASAALVLSVPGAERSPLQRWLAVTVVVAWFVLLASAVADAGALVSELGADAQPACAFQVVGLALLPGAWLFVMIRRAAPLSLAWSGGLAALASLALGALGAQVHCPIDAAGHLLVWHFAPVVVLGAAGAVAGRVWLTWRR
jgi:hypothetical protein